MDELIPDLGITSEPTNGIVVLRLSGELDVASATMLLQELRRLLTEDTRHVVIDVAELTYIDSTGVNLLASAANSFNLAKRRMCLLGRHGIVQRIFELAQLDEEIPSFGSLAEAEEYLIQPVRRTRRAPSRHRLTS